jgi:hypothetical protein
MRVRYVASEVVLDVLTVKDVVLEVALGMGCYVRYASTGQEVTVQLTTVMNIIFLPSN